MLHLSYIHTFPDNSGNSAIMFELQKRKEKRNHRLYRLWKM